MGAELEQPPRAPVSRDRRPPRRRLAADAARPRRATGSHPEAGRRSPLLPDGLAGLLRQAAIWLGFGLGYEVARAFADRGAGEALRNARRVIALESRLGGLFELDVQRLVLDAGSPLVDALNWTYWGSQFFVLTAGLVWVYLRRNHGYLRLRNTLFAVNLAGLVGYAAVPTAPPRLVPGHGFADTLSESAVSFHSPLVELLANPYAAMPSLHAADALVLAATLAAVVRSPAGRAAALLWPVWVWFSLIATGNHFWLDVLAGAALGALGVAGASAAARRHAAAPGPRR
ncbi:MAG TPA: phosphatase PAP2 family protein [Gaiellaceae bacterium]|nr:phosphatase PAP2 family protein [Gaiellaceae bacterium]